MRIHIFHGMKPHFLGVVGLLYDAFGWNSGLLYCRWSFLLIALFNSFQLTKLTILLFDILPRTYFPCSNVISFACA